MLSPTSNVNERLPGLRVRRESWLTALLLLAMLLAAESFLRWYGIRPSVADSTLLWSMTRAQARGDRVIAILGSSRSQLGLVPDVLAQEFPGWQVVHLGIDGTWPLAVLKDLATDPAFQGRILCELSESSLLPHGYDAAQAWVDHYQQVYPRASSLEKRFNEWWRVQMQARFALVSPALGLGSMALIGPYRSYEHMRADRHRPAHYRTRLPPDRLAEHRNNRVKRAQELLSQSRGARDEADLQQALRQQVRPLYDELKRRGGDLILVRMPTTGEHLTLDQIYYPREKFWDVIGPETGIPTIYFADYPELSGFDCPDTSHLDAEDAATFTRALARVIQTNRMWSSPPR